MLKVEALSKRYANGTLAGENLSFSTVGGVLGFLGPNGSGKTTLMSMLAIITTPTSGTFRWEGTDAVQHPDIVRRTLGYLPQGFGVSGRLTAREFLFYLARLKGLAAAAARERVATVRSCQSARRRRPAARQLFGGYATARGHVFSVVTTSAHLADLQRQLRLYAPVVHGGQHESTAARFRGPVPSRRELVHACRPRGPERAVHRDRDVRRQHAAREVTRS
jgi:ABC-type hemin transport system ATPase subunit